MKLLKGMGLHSISVSLFFKAELYFLNKCMCFYPEKDSPEEGFINIYSNFSFQQTKTTQEQKKHHSYHLKEIKDE